MSKTQLANLLAQFLSGQGGWSLSALLKHADLSESTSSARRSIEQLAVKINQYKITDPKARVYFHNRVMLVFEKRLDGTVDITTP